MTWTDRASLVFGRDLTLANMAERLVLVHGHRRMVEDAATGSSLTFAEAAARVEDMASGIRQAGVASGDRVVIATPNGYDQLLLCLAASRAGAIAVPVNARMRPEEIQHVEADSTATLVVRDAADVLSSATRDGAPPATPLPNEVAAILYTSGTTGIPKGVRLSHRGLLGLLGLAALWPTPCHRDEAVVALPVAHIMGLAALLALAAAGIPVYCLPRFQASVVLDAIESRRSTMFIGVPAMYRMLLDAGAESRDLRSVRAWASGADVMPVELARRFQAMGGTVTLPVLGATLGRAAFVEGYGMVETGGGVAAKLSLPGLNFPRTFGRVFGDLLGFPLPPNRFRVVGDNGSDVRVGQVGELWVKGPGVLEAYHGDAEATASVRTPEGWLRTGDLVRRGPFGVIGFVGRSKDVIKSGGYSVYAPEIERVVESHPDVLEAAAVGVPDGRLGEVPAVVVLLRDGASVTPEALQGWASERLSAYKAPRAVRIVTELPRTGTDKVAKRRLAALFADVP